MKTVYTVLKPEMVLWGFMLKLLSSWKNSAEIIKQHMWSLFGHKSAMTRVLAWT